MGEVLDVDERPNHRPTQLDCEGRPVTAATAVRPSNRRAGFMVKLGVVLAVLGGGLGVLDGFQLGLGRVGLDGVGLGLLPRTR